MAYELSDLDLKYSLLVILDALELRMPRHLSPDEYEDYRHTEQNLKRVKDLLESIKEGE